MNRRNFLKVAGAATLTLSNIGRVLAQDPRPAYHHWTWTHARQDQPPSQWQKNFAEIRAAGIGSVLLGGASEDACRLARAEGLDVHAWTWSLCRGGEDLLGHNPEWFVVSRDGKSACDQPPYVPYYHFLCPSRPEVQQYLIDDFSRIAETQGLSGAHMDYIRYPDVILPRALWSRYDLVQNEELPPFDFCYCDVCRENFKAQSGVDPLNLDDPAGHQEWRQYRWDSVTRLVNRLVMAIHEKGKTATAAVFPSPTIARKLVRQDWPSWNLDAVLPMVYHSFYEEDIDWIQSTVAEGVAALPEGRPLYSGLYLPELKGEGEFEAAVKASLDGGAQGVALFGGVRAISAG